MGLGDEIMALGRAERLHRETGKLVTICDANGSPRWHPAWDNHPALVKSGGAPMIDGPGARPYIKRWEGNKAVFDLTYHAEAGKIHLMGERQEPLWGDLEFAVVAPHLKDGASRNKDWGAERWEQVIADFPIPVMQLCENVDVPVIKGAHQIITKSFKDAFWVISQAAVVLCNEGGTHHMAASAGVPAVVVFGAFVPPSVTGYAIHQNIAVETEQGYCGNWQPCPHCKAAMDSITPAMVREKALAILESTHES